MVTESELFTPASAEVYELLKNTKLADCFVMTPTANPVSLDDIAENLFVEDHVAEGFVVLRMNPNL